MPLIVFLGCDGSGKSAVIQGLAERLAHAGISVTCGHWCPKPFADEENSASKAADQPHALPPRGLAQSVLKLGWLWLNWWFGWFQKLGKASDNGIVLFDRYHADLLVDPKRYRYGGPLWLARLASNLMPQPDRAYFLDASPETLLSRKQELPIEQLEKSRNRYLQLCRQSSRIKIIDASQPLEDVIMEIYNDLHPILPSQS
jgi:thymidylate kinase